MARSLSSHLVASILFRILLRPSSDQTSVASCSLRLGVLIVSVFIFESERKSESLNPGALPCRSLLLLGLNIDVFESIVIQQTLKITLHCHSHILIWSVEHCCVVFCLCTVPHSSFEVQRCVQHTLWSDVHEFLHCSQDVCSADVVVFHFNDKLANIMTETNTLLVEPTNSSTKDVCATRLCLALEQSHKHIRNVLHRSLLVHQSNAIELILASSISSVSSSAWRLVMPRVFAPIQARDQHQIFRKISIVVTPRILLALSRLIPNQARFLVLNL